MLDPEECARTLGAGVSGILTIELFSPALERYFLIFLLQLFEEQGLYVQVWLPHLTYVLESFSFV